MAVAKASPAGRRGVGGIDDTTALRVAETMGLLDGATAKHIGTTSPAAVVDAPLAESATHDELGRWLAANWGVLADTSPDLLDQIDL